MMLTVIIPALQEKYLQATIENVLDNSRGEIEVIAICDGYWPNPSIKDEPRVNIIHHSKPRGQRHSINEAARIAKGKYVLKLDAHCAVDEGFDVKLAADCQYDWTVVPRMFNLDIETFKPKMIDNLPEAFRKGKVHDYMYISHPDHRYEKKNQDYGFRAMYYGNFAGAKSQRPINDSVLIDDTMCCMGPGWFMHKDRFWELGGLDENHGHWGQMGVEVACKAWLSGGSFKVNKKTWFAHWFRGGITHSNGRTGWPYPISGKQILRAREYSKDLWLNNKWPKQVRTIEWLVNKFSPPTWSEHYVTRDRMELFAQMYKHIHRRKNDASWRGIDILKFPTDLILYQEVIHETKPELIVEIGTKFGGSALYFQDLLSMNGGGQVVTVDIKDQVKTKDPRIEYICANSIDDDVVRNIKNLANGKRTMLIIDGNHGRKHVKWELHKYWDIVTPGQYMVVEDCYIDRGLYGPGEAKQWFLERNKHFKEVDRSQKYLVGVTMGGWLQRI